MSDKEKKDELEEKKGCSCEECGDECDCDCGCDEDDELFELTDDEGNTVSFYPVASFEYQGESYTVFDPAEKSEEFTPGEAVILKMVEEGEDVVYSALENEEKLNEVFQEFLRLQEEEDEEEECDCGCHKDGCDCKH